MTTRTGGAPGWRRFLHPFVVVPAVALVAFGVWFLLLRSSGSSDPSSTTTRQLVNVTTGPLQQTVSAQGTIAALATQSLNFASSGEVTAVNVQAGSSVRAGDVLATLDPTALLAAEAQAEAALAQAEARLADDTAAGASEAQLNADRTAVATATDALTNARAALAGATLVASIDGIVSAVNISVGELLGASATGGTALTGSSSGSGGSSATVGGGNSTTANRQGTTSGSTTAGSAAQITIQTTGAYQVSLAIGSSDISKIAVGQNVNLTVTTSTNQSGGRGQTSTTARSTTTATAATATGTVSSVGSVATATSGVATFPVVVVFRADPTQFFVGGSVIADIVINSTGDVLQLPVRAVTVAPDGTSTVQLSRNGSLTATVTTVVTTGTVASGMVEIRSGLRKGDQVVVTTTITNSTATTVNRSGATRTQGSGG